MRKKILLSITATIVLIALLVYGYAQITYASVNKIPPLENGDLVFQTIKSPQTLAITLASKSPYSHVGIIKLDKSGNPLVVEAVGPVREISLEKWIEQGIAGRITILRIENLNTSEAQNALTKAKTYYGRPYDFLFLFDKDKIYCSELVYYAFKEGANIDLGKIEKIKNLEISNSATINLIKSRWQNYGPCISAGAKSYETCLPIVMEQKLITPVSIAEDPKLELVYSNY